MKKTYNKQLSAFSAKVKAVRMSKKLTQLELAAKMDVDVRTIKRMETKNYNPTLATVFAIAEALEIETRSLLT